MREYTVKQLARLAGVSVRTLHHYDAIGLLVPRKRTEAGRRIYGENEVMRLQHILLFRELGLSLNDIRRRLDAPDFDPLTALEDQRARLEAELRRLHGILRTIEHTLLHVSNRHELPVPKDLFAGFVPGRLSEFLQPDVSLDESLFRK